MYANDRSAQPCGCDSGANHRCAWHDEEDRVTQSAIETKPTNPKDAIGSDKLPLHLWPSAATALGSLGMLEGALKYGRNNWRSAGIRYTIYLDACERHIRALLEGEDYSPDTGTPHLANALACLAIIADAQANEMLTDDRNYVKGKRWRHYIDTYCTPHVARLKKVFADREVKHYTLQTNMEQAVEDLTPDARYMA